MMSDIFSIFDENNGNLMAISLVVWMLGFLALFLVFSPFWSGTNRLSVMFNLLKSVIFELIFRTKGKNLGIFFLFVSSLFCLIIILNFMGLLPYVFSPTSHLAFSFSLALPIWLSLMMSSMMWNYYSFISHFLPAGAPAILNPFLVIVEMVSVSVRPLTLSIRLTANMSAGHIVLTLVGGFMTVLLMNKSFFFSMMLYLVSSFYFIFEMGICCIQGYIFSLLLMLYSDEHS